MTVGEIMSKIDRGETVTISAKWLNTFLMAASHVNRRWVCYIKVEGGVATLSPEKVAAAPTPEGE